MKLESKIVELIIIIFAITVLLNILLFFKIWGMTNNARKIKELLGERLGLEHPVIQDEKDRVVMEVIPCFN